MHRHRDRENYNAPVRGKWAKIVFFGISFLAGFSIHTQNATAESLSQKDQTNMAMEKIAAKYVQKIATYPPILPMTEISDALRQQLDAEFNAAIKELAEKRLATRANEIDATPIFQKIITRHSVEVLHHYLSKRYGLERETDGGGNNDLQQWSYVGNPATSLDNRFYRYDKLTLGFDFSPDWVRIDSFSARLTWNWDWP